MDKDDVDYVATATEEMRQASHKLLQAANTASKMPHGDKDRKITSKDLSTSADKMSIKLGSSPSDLVCLDDAVAGRSLRANTLQKSSSNESEMCDQKRAPLDASQGAEVAHPSG